MNDPQTCPPFLSVFSLLLISLSSSPSLLLFLAISSVFLLNKRTKNRLFFNVKNSFFAYREFILPKDSAGA